MAGELEAIGRQLIPLFARDLARLAADANRRIGKEAHAGFLIRAGIGHWRVLRWEGVGQIINHFQLLQSHDGSFKRFFVSTGADFDRHVVALKTPLAE